MKRMLLVGALTAACLSVLAYGTAAYFTAQDTAQNVITAGNIAVALKETALPADGGDPVPFEDVIGVMPGTEVSKIVQVENTGDHPAYIRIRVDKALTLAQGQEDAIDLDLVGLDIDTAHWTEKDGYYYYNQPLAAGDITPPLFTQVSFSKEMDDRYQDGRAAITVLVSATQAENNGDTALQAAGWPVE